MKKKKRKQKNATKSLKGIKCRWHLKVTKSKSPTK